ncbi:MAG: amidohydrolase family protein [Saprospiraceae bacterium]|nr:amidohydrolase family protein [Saprospiraceae bacterium]
MKSLIKGISTGMHTWFSIYMVLFLGAVSWAQPAPGPAQQAPIAIIGATIHTGDGKVIEEGVILFEDGKITAVDAMSRNKEWQKDKYTQIQAKGKQVYPGLIAMYSTLGLNEIESIRPTQDYAETGADNPNARAIIAYNTDSRVIPTVRSNGVLLAQIVPRSGRWPGMTSVVQLDAWNWEDAAYAMDEGLFLQWPSLYTSSGWWAEPSETNRNKAYQSNLDELDQFMKEARAYSHKNDHREKNLRFEAMRPLFDGSRKLYIQADQAPAIQDAVIWAKKYGITPVIIGGQDSWQITSFLKENGIAIVLPGTHHLPSHEDDDIDQPFKTPALLKAAGVDFAITVDGYWQQRNLPYQAGQAVGYGLTREAALEAITAAPARILGLDQRTGTLRVGLDANLFICTGDVLDIRTSKVEKAFIQGREINLDNHHKQLYQKYKAKYGE